MKKLISLAIIQFLIVAVVNAQSSSALPDAAKSLQEPEVNPITTKVGTSASALTELKTSGVPDEIVLAMLERSRTSSQETLSVRARDEGESVIKVPDGTEIEIALTNTLSGQEANVGDVVDFVILRDVTANGIIVFEQGASARARVTTAKRAGRWGKAGKLEWVMQDVQAVDGKRIPARFTKRLIGQSNGNQVAITAVATSMLLGPWSLFWGLKKGKPAIIPAGNRYIVFVEGDVDIDGKGTK
jgi:hypothetical protein